MCIVGSFDLKKLFVLFPVPTYYYCCYLVIIKHEKDYRDLCLAKSYYMVKESFYQEYLHLIINCSFYLEFTLYQLVTSCTKMET